MSLKSDESEDPHHLQRNGEVPCPIRHEKIRLIVLGPALLALLTGFCLYLLSPERAPALRSDGCRIPEA